MSSFNKLLRRALGALGVIVALFSSMFVIMAIGDILGGNNYKASLGVVWALLVFFMGTLTSGGLLARWGFAQPRPEEPVLSENEQIRSVLQLAKQSQGTLTLLEVAAETQLSLPQSKVLLEDLVTQQIAQMVLRDDGVIVYAFPEFQPESHPYQLPGE